MLLQGWHTTAHTCTQNLVAASVWVLQHVAQHYRLCTYSVQYASDLLNLLSFPVRPASSAARLFPVAEEQHDSLPALGEKYQVCCPSPSYIPSTSKFTLQDAFFPYFFFFFLIISSFCHLNLSIKKFNLKASNKIAAIVNASKLQLFCQTYTFWGFLSFRLGQTHDTPTTVWTCI